MGVDNLKKRKSLNKKQNADFNNLQPQYG